MERLLRLRAVRPVGDLRRTDAFDLRVQAEMPMVSDPVPVTIAALSLARDKGDESAVVTVEHGREGAAEWPTSPHHQSPGARGQHVEA